MSLRVSGKNINIGEALRIHVGDRLKAAAGKYFDGELSGHVTISPEGSGFRADCSLHLNGIDVQADGRAQEPYASFDQAADRIEKRLRRYKSRLKDHHALREDGEVAQSYVLEAPDQEQDAPKEFAPTIVAEATSRLRRLTVSAAVLDLDLTGAPVVVFRNADTGRLNVVYRRGDDHIGWIDAPGGE
ncbi:ribosome hibernation-promoting factor, HPF/YfiA family [Methylosinus sp. LW4]|uniref:ribosome hibernation-promoting factor, HPF/YfiA family n=1 Tax=Methylosinus sp. LW4 TaxID=136993 RepID=UPI00037E5185|nr:ribosome-associated translation inhibitor RaiA [Methylosinus sp. LW4]